LPRITYAALRFGLFLPSEDERGLLASDINEMGSNETGSNEMGMNEMGVNKTDELSVNEMGVNDMGSEQASLLSYGKEKHNEPFRQAESKSSRFIIHSL